LAPLHDQDIIDLRPPRTLEVSREALAFMERAFEEGSVGGGGRVMPNALDPPVIDEPARTAQERAILR
jgi:hypothetical protein